MNKFTIKTQSGAVLVISLIMLLALTIIGMTSTSVTGLEEKMAANTKEINLAFQAAEATLRYVEDTQLASSPFNSTVRSTTDANLGANGIYTTVKSCENADASANQRLSTDTPLLLDATKRPFYEKVDWDATGASIKYRTYDIGTGTNKKLKNIAKNPEYILEEVSCTAMTDSNSANNFEAGVQQSDSLGEIITIRITARGWGSNQNAVVTLQSIVKMQYKN